jgi:hypothetical protein
MAMRWQMRWRWRGRWSRFKLRRLSAPAWFVALVVRPRFARVFDVAGCLELILQPLQRREEGHVDTGHVDITLVVTFSHRV